MNGEITCRIITGLGYDTAKMEEVLVQVRAQLNNIHTAERRLKEKAQEYRTLKQLDAYTTLSTDKRFTHGPKWQEAFGELDYDNIHSENSPNLNSQDVDIIKTRTKFNQEISFDL